MLIKRYLRRELLIAMAVIMVVLMVVFMSNQLIRYLNAATIGKAAGGGAVLQILFYEMPNLFGLLLPLGLYLGILLAYGRLYSDSELLVLHAFGMSRRQLLRITMSLAGGVFVIVALLSFWLTPMALTKRDAYLQQAGLHSILAILLPGRFQYSADHHTVFLVKSLSRDRQAMQDVFVAQQTQTTAGEQWRVLTADYAQQQVDEKTGVNYIVLHNGERYTGVPGQRDYQRLQFKEYALRVEAGQKQIVTHAEDTLSTQALWQQRHQLSSRGMAELQWRFCIPLSVIILCCLAVGLSRLRPRSGRYSRLLPAVLIYSCYANLMFVSRAWLQKGVISPWLGLWWVQVALAAAAVLVWVLQHEQYTFARFKQKYLGR